jgi:hypothetical protein
MDYKNKRAGGGALGGLRVDCAAHLTPDRPQAKARPDLLTRLRFEVPVFRDYLPLALRIREALHAAFPDATRTAVIHALAMHGRCDNYLKAIAAGGARYALDGAPSGEVSQAHRVAAVLRLARRSEKSVKPPIPKVVSTSPVLRLARRRA